MNEIENKFWNRINRYLPVLKFVPFIKMVAVCNNLAFSKVNKNSDIDLFIIAKKKRLFIVRTFVTFLLHVLGVRRHGNKIAGRFCLTFFVDETFLNFSKIAIKDDIYLAYWMRTMIPVIDFDNTAEIFLNQNVWIKDFFEKDEKLMMRKDKIFKKNSFTKIVRKIFELILNGLLGDYLEYTLKKWQIERANRKNAKSKGDSIIIDEHILKFHKIDRRREYRNKWFSKYNRNMKLTDERFLRL